MPSSARRGPRDDYATIRRLADRLLPALVARLEASPLGELEVSQDGWRVRVRGPSTGPASGSDRPAHPVGPGRGTPAGGGKRKRIVESVAGSRDGRRERSPEQDDPSRRVVTSPAVGTFHPRADTTPGRHVQAGDVVGHVEVLGVPQEVLAPFDGILGRLLAEPGQVVEYGEQLMRIEAK